MAVTEGGQDTIGMECQGVRAVKRRRATSGGAESSTHQIDLSGRKEQQEG